MFSEEVRIKQGLSQVSFCSLKILYNSKFILMASSFGTNAVIVMMVQCSIFEHPVYWIPYLPKIIGYIYSVNTCPIQPNLNSLNTNDSFTMDDSNFYLSPYEILPIAQENKYLDNFSYFIMKLYVVCNH